MIAVKRVTVACLELAAKSRFYVFTVSEEDDEATIDRYERGRRVRRETVTRDEARGRWNWLRGCGYEVW